MSVAWLIGWVAAATMVLGVAVPVRAAGIPYTTPPGSTQDSKPVNVSATFTTGTNSLVVVVNNLQANPASAIENLSDLDFVISTGQTAVGSGGRLTSTSGAARTVGKAPSGNNQPFTTRWVLRQSSSLPFELGTRFTLCVICSSGGTEVSWPTGNPVQTIIGDAAASGFYTNAGSSIAGNGSHNPFLFGPVMSNLTLAALSETPTLTGVAFSLGASAAADPQGCVACTSVPSAVLLLVLGLFVAAGIFVQSRWREARRDVPPVA